MIELNHVTYRYQNQPHPVICDLDLSVPAGSCIVITGKSGCGKTTLTRLMNGLAFHFYQGICTGSIRIDGLNPAEEPLWKIGQRAGSVLQDPSSQFFAEKAQDEIAFGCENYGMPRTRMKKRIQAAAKLTTSETLLQSNLFQLSSGQQQRLAIAGIYAVNPNLYVFDEPSANLDEVSVMGLQRLIHRLKTAGKTLIIAEHRLYYLTDVADRFFYMKNGQLVHEFCPQELINLSREKFEGLGLRAARLPDCKIPPAAKSSGNATAADPPLPSLEVCDLTFAYKKNTVIDRLSFRAWPGEIIAITGSNGAGKTTLARLLCGLLKERTGTIRLFGRKTGKKLRRKQTFFVMQHADSQLFTENCAAEVRMSLPHQSGETAEHLLQCYHLSEQIGTHPSLLSGGQKQRLILAVAEAIDPNILLLDEPTSGLDGDNMRIIAERLRKMAENKKTILVITHDQEFICQACSRIICLKDGKIAEDRFI